jgi:hypothetical protein
MGFTLQQAHAAFGGSEMHAYLSVGVELQQRAVLESHAFIAVHGRGIVRLSGFLRERRQAQPPRDDQRERGGQRDSGQGWKATAMA